MTLRWPSGGHCRGGRKLLSSAARPGVWGLAPMKKRWIESLHLMWVGAGSHSLPRKIPRNLSRDIPDLGEHMSRLLLCLLHINHRRPRPRRRPRCRMLLEFRILHSNLLLGINIQFNQTADLELVDFDSVGICSGMETDGNELNNDFLDEI